MTVAAILVEWLGILLAPIAWLLYRQHTSIAELREAHATLVAWRQAHEREDARVHERLHESVDVLTAELRLARTESSEQHTGLMAKLDDVRSEGAEGRRDLHRKLDRVSSSVDRLIGAESARRGEPPA